MDRPGAAVGGGYYAGVVNPPGPFPPGNLPPGQFPQGHAAQGQASRGYASQGHASQGYQGPPPPPPGPRSSTWVIVAVLGFCVLVATLWGLGRSPGPEPGPGPTPSSSSSATPTGGVPLPDPPEDATWIDYVSSEGEGRLVINDHTNQGGYTVVDLTITSTAGDQTFAFAAFDADGTYYEPDPLASPSPDASAGVLRHGETVRGNVAFPVQDGPFTLLMSNEAYESITAVMVE